MRLVLFITDPATFCTECSWGSQQNRNRMGKGTMVWCVLVGMCLVLASMMGAAQAKVVSTEKKKRK